MIAAGALAGIVGGFVAQILVGPTTPELASAAGRFVMLVPGAVFVAWWIVVPGLAMRGHEVVAASGSDVDLTQATLDRIEAIGVMFDEHAGREWQARMRPQFAGAGDQSGETTSFTGTLRRPQRQVPGDIARFAVRRAGGRAS